MAALGTPSVVAGWRPKVGELRHVSRVFADTLYPWVLREEHVPQARVLIPEAAALEARDWLMQRRGVRTKPLVAMHPGASSREKRWPLDRYRSVAALLEPSSDLLLIEGPAEPGLTTELALWLRPEGRVLAASLPLRLLAAVLSCCDAYLGNDSGISHLAAALGLRSVVIFGPTLPEQWSPTGPSVSVLRDPTGCAACANAGNDRHSCLENISVDGVWACLSGLQPG
jgi:ADP-heptose:LPS heptosyltransferase